MNRYTPPINVLTSLLRRMKVAQLKKSVCAILKSAIGEGKTRRDHSDVSNQV